MAAAGAPKSYLVINLAALVIGLALLALLQRNRPPGGNRLAGAGRRCRVAGDGAVRHDDGRRDALGAGRRRVAPAEPVAAAGDDHGLCTRPERRRRSAMLVAALALALQPDRAMAGALVAGLPRWRSRHATGGAAGAGGGAGRLCGHAGCAPIRCRPAAFVEQVFAERLCASSLLAGAALLAGSALMLLPALALPTARGAGVCRGLADPACWRPCLAITRRRCSVMAAAASLAICLCLAALPRHARAPDRRQPRTNRRIPTNGSSAALPRRGSPGGHALRNRPIVRPTPITMTPIFSTISGKPLQGMRAEPAAGHGADADDQRLPPRHRA